MDELKINPTSLDVGSCEAGELKAGTYPTVKLIEPTEKHDTRTPEEGGIIKKLTIKIDQAHYEALAKLAELDDRSIAQTARRIMKGAITSTVKGFTKS